MEEYRKSRMDEKMEQGNVIFLNQVLFDNTLFWAYFLSVNYPCSLHKETDCTMADFVEKVMPINIEWSDCFTQYDKNPDVFDESDGYLDHPTTLTTSLGSLGNLKIEFHPGDTIFFLNNNEIGCTGPHWVLSKIPYQTIKNVLELEYGEVLFELLLPINIRIRGSRKDKTNFGKTFFGTWLCRAESFADSRLSDFWDYSKIKAVS